MPGKTAFISNYALLACCVLCCSVGQSGRPAAAAVPAPQGGGRPVLPGPGQASVWQPATSLQWLPGYHEGVQVTDVSTHRRYMDGIQLPGSVVLWSRCTIAMVIIDVVMAGGSDRVWTQETLVSGITISSSYQSMKQKSLQVLNAYWEGFWECCDESIVLLLSALTLLELSTECPTCSRATPTSL